MKYLHFKLGLMSLLTAVTLALLALSTGSTPQAAAQTQPPTDTPCIPEDPYDLEDLRAILNTDTPPSIPQQINEHLTVEFVGTGTLVEEDPVTPENTEETGTENPEELPAEETEYREVAYAVFNTRTKFEFKVTMKEAMLDDIHNCRQTAGLEDASVTIDDITSVEFPRLFIPMLAHNAPAVPPQDTAAPMGWSNGVDTRMLVSNPNVWPLRTIAQFRGKNSSTQESGCSGTLIGPRHIITAAHCINKQGTTQWYSPRITPAKNGFGTGLAQEPYGSTDVSVNPAPGTEVWYFTPWQWRDEDLTGWQYDFGLLVIPDRLGDETGWMGYFAASANYLNSVNKWNRGYPLCNNDRGNAPENCQVARMYRDVNECAIGSFSNPGPDGWNRRVSVSCDMSGGHSGSPVYFYHYKESNQTWVPVVTMITSTESCALCQPSSNFPNGMVRITPSHIGTISWLRETFP